MIGRFCYGKGAQKRCFDNAEKNNVYACIQTRRGGVVTRGFKSFKSFRELLKFQDETPEEDRCFYEIIRNECCEYYDIDGKWDDGWNNIQEYVSKFLYLRSRFGKENTINDRPVNFTDLIITEACNKEKMSLHILIRQPTYFKSCKNQKVWAKAFQDWIEINEPESKIKLDLSVYSGNSQMRLVGSHKFGDTERKFKPFGLAKKIKDKRLFLCSYVPGMDDPATRFLPIHIEEKKRELQDTVHEEASEGELKSLLELIIESIQDEKHSLCDKEHPDKVCYDKWKEVAFAIIKLEPQKKEREGLFMKWAPLYRHQNMGNIDKMYEQMCMYDKYGWNIGTLHFYAMENEKYETVFGTNKKIRRLHSLKNSNYIKIIKVDESVKWVQPINFPEGYRSIGIKQYLGGGKTTAIIDYINSNKDSRKILVLSPRCSFARSITREYNQKISEAQEKFVCYLDVKVKDSLGTNNRIVCSMESVHYLDKARFVPDLIILDECQANLVSHTCLATNGRNMENNMYIFKRFLLNEKTKIIFADAFLGSKTTNFINNLHIPTVIYNHQRKMAKRKILRVPRDKKYKNDSLLEVIKKSFCSDEKNYIFCSSKAKAVSWHKQISTLFPHKKFILYTGGCTIGDVNKEWSLVDGVITTSTITVGINFDKKDYFHNIFIYCSACSYNLVSDIFQSHFRVRHIINNKVYVFILPTINKTRSTFYPRLMDDFKWKETFFTKKTGVKGFEEAEYYFKCLVVDNMYETNMSSMFLEKMFNYYAKECNYEEADDVDEEDYFEDVQFDIEMSDVKIDPSEVAFDEIKLLDEFETKMLRIKRINNIELSEMEKDQLDKKSFVVCFSRNGCAWVDKKYVSVLWALWKDWGRTKIRMLRNEKKIIAEECTIKDLYRKQCDEVALAGILSNRLLKIEWMLNICKTLGLKNSTDIATCIPYELVDKIHNKLTKQQKDIRNSFELRDQSKGEYSITNTVKLLNSIFKQYGFTKFVKSKKKRKRVNGKRVDCSDYKLENDNDILKAMGIEPGVVFDYIDLSPKERKRLLED